MGDTHWNNEELRSFEEELPEMKKEGLERAARSYMATTGAGCDGFHPRVP